MGIEQYNPFKNDGAGNWDHYPHAWGSQEHYEIRISDLDTIPAGGFKMTPAVIKSTQQLRSVRLDANGTGAEREADFFDSVGHPNIFTVLDIVQRGHNGSSSIALVTAQDTFDFQPHFGNSERQLEVVRRVADAVDHFHKNGIALRGISVSDLATHMTGPARNSPVYQIARVPRAVTRTDECQAEDLRSLAGVAYELLTQTTVNGEGLIMTSTLDQDQYNLIRAVHEGNRELASCKEFARALTMATPRRK